MEFLKGYIGLKGLNTETGVSEFVNDLPGVSLEIAEAIADKDQKTAAGVWQQIESRAIERLEEDLKLLATNSAAIYKSVLDTAPGFTVITPMQTQAAPVEHRAVRVTYPYGRFISVFVRSVFFYSADAIPVVENTGGVLIRVLDAITGAELYSQRYPVKHGLNEYAINRQFYTPAQSLEYIITAEAESLRLLTLKQTAGHYDQTKALRYEPGTYAAEFTGVDETTIGANIEILCSLEKYIRENKEAFKVPLKYLLASELFREKLMTPRTGFLAVKNIARVEDLQQEYEANYLKSLKNRFKTIPLTQLCGRVKTVTPYSKISLV